MQINHEVLKIAVPSVIQVFLAFAALRLSWVLHKDKSQRETADLKLKLYDRRYNFFLEFEHFVSHCAVNDIPDLEGIREFSKCTERIDFLFGNEIKGYRKEVIANAIAVVGLERNFPRELRVGGIVGFFPGSTILNTSQELRAWFVQQHKTDLRKYFAPYLNFEDAGVNPNARKMKPPELPDPPLVRRQVSDKEVD